MPTGQRGYASFDLQEIELRGDFRGGAAGPCSKLVHSRRTVAHRIEQGMRGLSSCHRVGSCARGGHSLELREDILGAFDELGAFLDERVAALRNRGMDGAG